MSKYNFPVIPLSPPKAKTESKISKSVNYFSYLYKLYRLIKKEKFNVVHFQFFRRRRVESLYFAILKLLRVNLAHTVHDVTPLDESKLDHQFNLLVYRKADTLFVHSNTNKNVLLKQIEMKSDKIKVVPHGDFDIFLPNQIVSKSQGRKNLGLTDEDNVVLFFGFIKEYKGLDILIESLPYAAKEIKNLAVVVAGNSDTEELKQHYLNLIEKLPDEIKLIFHCEFIPEDKVADYFVATDVVVLPYRRISHSGVLHLAYTFGRPIIATKVGDFEETIEHGKSGFVMSENTADNLSQLLIKFFSDRNLIEEMGNYARMLSETKYSWGNSAKLMKPIYRQMLEKN